MEGVQPAADVKVDELRMFGLARQGLTCWMAGLVAKGETCESEWVRWESWKLLMFVLTFMTNFQCIPSPSFSFPSNDAFLSGDEKSIIGWTMKEMTRQGPWMNFEFFLYVFHPAIWWCQQWSMICLHLVGLIIFFRECVPLSPYVLLIGLLMNGRLHLLTSLSPRCLARA